jgi:hypothetical protein
MQCRRRRSPGRSLCTPAPSDRRPSQHQAAWPSHDGQGPGGVRGRDGAELLMKMFLGPNTHHFHCVGPQDFVLNHNHFNTTKILGKQINVKSSVNAKQIQMLPGRRRRIGSRRYCSMPAKTVPPFRAQRCQPSRRTGAPPLPQRGAAPARRRPARTPTRPAHPARLPVLSTHCLPRRQYLRTNPGMHALNMSGTHPANASPSL